MFLLQQGHHSPGITVLAYLGFAEDQVGWRELRPEVLDVVEPVLLRACEALTDENGRFELLPEGKGMTFVGHTMRPHLERL